MSHFLKSLRQIFFKGLFTFLPIAVTIYILYAGIAIMESLLGSTIERLFPQLYIPGLGFLLTIVFIFLLGFLLNNLLTAGLFSSLEHQLEKVPFIKAIYSPLKDLMNLFTHNGAKGLKSVVLVELGPGEVKAMGLITRDSFHDLPLKGLVDGYVTVFIPFSYGLGGVTLLVHRSKITEVDLPAERAMSLAITGWVKVAPKPDAGGGANTGVKNE
jgi:uncharacterized membrane protein